MAKLPYMAFYIGDWLTDPAVSLCTPATRGVWIDLLSAMHGAGRVGSLTGTREQLARLGRCVPADLALALTDLQATGAADVSERNGVITVVNRRMRREAQEREATRLRQAKFRAEHGSEKGSNGDVTQMSPSEDGIEAGSFFSSDLPEVLNTKEFRKQFGEWLRYKVERRESYKEQGLASMISRAARLATEHGLPAVIDAMERAIANHWAGWDQPSVFSKGKSHGKSTGPSHIYDPDAGNGDPNFGRMD